MVYYIAETCERLCRPISLLMHSNRHPFGCTVFFFFFSSHRL